ncbi:MAG: MOSC N-terminal beta barrel domain-containing protein [Burkholderiaceae bacterium]|nr:MOSC N-terminal beta barrel domain-containing protein [Burkholderiaceae bacterium]
MTNTLTSKFPAKHDIGRDVRAKIAQLFIYPIKSCAGIELKEAVLTDTGLDLDRAWMVVDTAGEFVTQRELPRMALIQPLLTSFDMIIKAPGMPSLKLAIDDVQQAVTVKVWEDAVKAFDMGDEAAQWFSDFLNKPLRLVRFDPEQTRLSSMTWTDGIEAKNSFDDGFAVLLTSVASLKVLNDKLVAAGEQAVTMQRFRPNIVLTGIDAYDEDRLDTLHISTQGGVVQLKPVKPCARCPIPDVDPKTGKSSPVVGDMLQTYRQNPQLDGAVTLGMNAIILAGEGAVLRVGQSAEADYLF